MIIDIVYSYFELNNFSILHISKMFKFYFLRTEVTAVIFLT